MNRWDSDTGIGAGGGAFPETRWSAVQALSHGGAARRQAWEIVVAVYWKPVYKYLRIRWRKSNEDAKDLTQAFFARAFEKDFFVPYDPSKARFRTYLRTCLDGFTANTEKAAAALKRGGGVEMLPLDFHQAEAELAMSAASPEQCFDREWIRSLFAAAIEQLRATCAGTGRSVHYALFEAYDIERDPGTKPTYTELAGRFAISPGDVTNYLAWARREFRKCVLNQLREITGSEEEFRSEARRLLGLRAQ
jgi:DNA-directed RNA polymerase specialized sigma24 family protein